MALSEASGYRARCEIFFLMVMLLVQISLASASFDDDLWYDDAGYPDKINLSDGDVRSSISLNFDIEHTIEGTAKPITVSNGRVIAPAQSYYSNVAVKKLVLKERTYARQGSYSSREVIRARLIYNHSSNLVLVKKQGSSLYTVYDSLSNYMKIAKSTKYSGLGIDDREFWGNKRAYVRSDFLNNANYIKETTIGTEIVARNATVDPSTNVARIILSKNISYILKAHTTGMADLKYRQTMPDNAKRPVISEGEERYYGTFDISRKINMTVVDYSREFKPKEVFVDDEWLSCCLCGYSTMDKDDQLGHSADGIFNCTCYSPPEKAQFPTETIGSNLKRVKHSHSAGVHSHILHLDQKAAA